MEERFDDFTRERRYLKGVSERTIDWYEDCFAAWRKHSDGGDYKKFIINLRNKGTSAISVNTYICGMNAYFKWAGVDLKIGYLKEEQKILATLSADAMRRLMSYRPRGTNITRAHLVALTILDTGLRASEVLKLTHEAVDYDNLVMKVHGKGGKHRLIPLSLELRKQLYRHTVGRKQANRRLLFGTKHDTPVTLRNIERDFKVLGQKCGITGIRFSPHTLRHSFAVSYLRNGGNLEYPRRILGHSSISTTQKYLRSLGVEDLGAVHNSLSPLSAKR